MSFDELQRPLDAASNRIVSLGDPTAADDATKTDNVSAPANPAAAASAGASFKAAPANHVHQGVHSVHADGNANLYGDVRLVSGTGIAIVQSGQDMTIAASGASVNKITFADPTEGYVTGTGEEILREWAVNFDDCGSGGNIQARLTAIVSVGAGTGTYRVRVGATSPGATAGSTVRATFTSTSTTEEVKTNLGSAFAVPSGAAIVQLTAVNDTALTKSFIRGSELSFG